MPTQPPPPILNSARVMAYALVGDDIPFLQRTTLYVNDVLLGRVPRLAICLNLGKDIGALLYHCDKDWNVLGTSGGDTIEAAKQFAERNYPGLMPSWVHLDTSVEEALRYYDAQTQGQRCSFCGKRPLEIDGFVEGRDASICRGCVEDFYKGFHESDNDARPV